MRNMRYNCRYCYKQMPEATLFATHAGGPEPFWECISCTADRGMQDNGWRGWCYNCDCVAGLREETCKVCGWEVTPWDKIPNLDIVAGRVIEV